MVLHLVYVPTVPRRGWDARRQFRAAREVLYQLTLEDFEAKIRDELTRMLGPGGFDAEADILGITVNRWGHGYSYMGDPLFEDDRRRRRTLRTARGPCGNMLDRERRRRVDAVHSRSHRAGSSCRLRIAIVTRGGGAS